MKPKLATPEEQIEAIDAAVAQGAWIYRIETSRHGATITFRLNEESRDWTCGFEAASHARLIMDRQIR